jgi:hypothetical protein
VGFPGGDKGQGEREKATFHICSLFPSPFFLFFTSAKSLLTSSVPLYKAFSSKSLQQKLLRQVLLKKNKFCALLLVWLRTYPKSGLEKINHR